MSQDLGPHKLLEVAKTGSLENLLKLLDNEISSNPCDSTLNTRDPPESELSSTDPSEIAAASTDLCESKTTSDALNAERKISQVDATNDFRNRALWLAAAEIHDVAIQTLISAGADVNIAGCGRSTPLIMVARTHNLADSDMQKNCVKLLLQASADVDAQDEDGCTALMLAARAGSVNCVQLLLKAGSDVGIVNDEGKTALMIASFYGKYSCVEVLVKERNCQINAVCAHRLTALTYAVKGFKERCCEQSLLSGALNTDKSTLSAVCDCVKLLIEAGADVNIGDIHLNTPLMYATTNDAMVDLLRVMLQADGVDVNLRDSKGRTAVTSAVSSGSPQCLQCLVNSGASFNIVGYLNKTPLHYFMTGHDDYSLAQQCLKILLDRGANVNAADLNGVTPLMHVAGKTWAPDALDLLVKHGANVNLLDNEGRSALIYALRPSDFTGRFKNAEYLLQNGADPNLDPFKKKLALDFAMKGRLFLLKILIEHGLELEVDWEKFHKILHFNNLKTLQLLIINGMMPTPKISSGPTKEKVESSCIQSALGSKSKIFLIKYFIVNCYLRNDDLTFIRHMCKFGPRSIIEKILKPYMVGFCSQPWPLVKLSFVTVSTLLGASPGRRERIKKSQLPNRLQDMLMFNDPLLRLSSLCPYYWDRIPLTFNPEEYERLPRPRPLLYHWPVGRPLVKCDCGLCRGTMYKFEGDGEHRDS